MSTWCTVVIVVVFQALPICLADIKPNGEETEWQQQVCKKALPSVRYLFVVFFLELVVFSHRNNLYHSGRQTFK